MSNYNYFLSKKCPTIDEPGFIKISEDNSVIEFISVDFNLFSPSCKKVEIDQNLLIKQISEEDYRKAENVSAEGLSEIWEIFDDKSINSDNIDPDPSIFKEGDFVLFWDSDKEILLRIEKDNNFTEVVRLSWYREQLFIYNKENSPTYKNVFENTNLNYTLFPKELYDTILEIKKAGVSKLTKLFSSL